MMVRLVILGLLREGPLHGYEIKQRIEERMGDWTSIAFGSIYYALNRLAGEGLIEAAATEQEGGRPSRTVYRITADGRAHFLRLLREVWAEVERQYYTVDVGLFFADALPRGEVEGYLEGRITHLKEAMSNLEKHRDAEMADERVPRRAEMIFEHTLVHLWAEVAWAEDLLDRVRRDGI